MVLEGNSDFGYRELPGPAVLLSSKMLLKRQFGTIGAGLKQTTGLLTAKMLLESWFGGKRKPIY